MHADARVGRLRAALVAASLAWAVMIVGAPLVRMWRAGTTVALVAALPYAVGARVCHQRPERSFHTGGVRWPVCGRCTGLYVSGAVGVLLAAALSHPRRGTLAVAGARGILGVAAAPTLLTWALEVAGLWNPGTPLRAMAAIPLGLAIGWSLDRTLRD